MTIALLVSVKQRHVDLAGAALLSAKNALRDRRAEVERTERDLHAHIKWSREEKDRLFTRLAQRLTDLKALEEYERQCNGFKLRAEAMKQELRQAQSALEQARQQYESARKRLLQAEKNLEKFTQVNTWLTEAEKQEALRREESLLDDQPFSKPFSGLGGL